jgi:alpha-L-rhamnosidase
LLPDGTISDLTMNSFNHYSYGSIMEWVYRNSAGIQPVEDHPGFRRARLVPQPDKHLKWVKVGLDSAAGRYESEWAIHPDGKLTFHYRVPFNASASLKLPDAALEDIKVNGTTLSSSGLHARQDGSSVSVDLSTGDWDFEYMPTQSYLHFLSTNSPLDELLNNPAAKEALIQAFPQFAHINPGMLNRFRSSSLREIAGMPMTNIPTDALDPLDIILKQIVIE